VKGFSVFADGSFAIAPGCAGMAGWVTVMVPGGYQKIDIK